MPATWQRGLRRDRREGEGAPSRERIGAIAGDLAARRGDVRAEGADAPARRRQSRLPRRTARRSIRAGAARAICSTPTIAGIEQADALLIIGANPRKEAPVLNARIRKRWRAGNFTIGVIGEKARSDLSTMIISAPGRRRSPTVANASRRRKLRTADLADRPGRPGARRTARDLALAAKAALAVGAIKDGWNGFNVLHTAAARVGALDLGFVPGAGG